MKTSKLQRFQYNEDLNKWLWFVAETLVSAFVGALIAFVFGSHYWAALSAFGILMLFLLLLAAVLIVFENRVSILSIMNQGLKDGKYEDVIKFGSAMRGTLFTSNKNEEIVVLGGKIDAAASNIESAHYNNSKGDYLVTVDGTPKSITQIRIGLKIDDLGWSMHLCKRTDEAVTNIIDGMKAARHKALTLAHSNESNHVDRIIPLVQLILRGYRHLSGIYYEDVNQHWQATFYESVTKLIMSNYRSISHQGACESHSGEPVGTTCGLFCGSMYESKVACSRKNILALYFKEDSDGNHSPNILPVGLFDRLNGTQGGLMSIAEIEDDTFLYSLLPKKTRNQIAKEQCYAWGRNIVKKVQNGMHRQGENDFLSDAEFSSLVAEARAFSQIYYYGTDTVPTHDDFHSVINKPVLGKSEVRYASLMNEIELVKLLLPSSERQESDTNSERNVRIEQLINNLRSTREICRDKRADLYVRASAHLITAYHLEYNLKYRYLTNDIVHKSAEARTKLLTHYQRTIRELYKEIIRYEHKTDDDLQKKYSAIMEDLSNARKALKKKYFVTLRENDDAFASKFSKIDPAQFQKHINVSRLSSAAHDFSPDEIQKVKAKWGLE
jgi:hypothetical protein